MTAMPNMGYLGSYKLSPGMALIDTPGRQTREWPSSGCRGGIAVIRWMPDRGSQMSAGEASCILAGVNRISQHSSVAVDISFRHGP